MIRSAWAFSSRRTPCPIWSKKIRTPSRRANLNATFGEERIDSNQKQPRSAKGMHRSYIF